MIFNDVKMNLILFYNDFKMISKGSPAEWSCTYYKDPFTLFMSPLKWGWPISREALYVK